MQGHGHVEPLDSKFCSTIEGPLHPLIQALISSILQEMLRGMQIHVCRNNTNATINFYTTKLKHIQSETCIEMNYLSIILKHPQRTFEPHTFTYISTLCILMMLYLTTPSYLHTHLYHSLQQIQTIQSYTYFRT